MTIRTWRIAAAALLCASPAIAAPSPIGYTAPDGVNAVAVTTGNPLPVTCAACGGGASGVANAAAPTRTEGQTSVPPSYDLSGNQRVVDAAVLSAINSATPAGTNAIGTVGITGAPVTTASAAISIAASTTQVLVAGVSGKLIYVNAWDVVLASAGTFQLEYSASSSCTSPTVLTGSYSFATNGGIAKTGGVSPLYIIPAGASLCGLNGAGAAAGSVSYAQQ